jgi:hypothetical protein
MLRLRFSLAAPVAALLLLGGPARAATTRPASGATIRPLVRRGPTSRLGGVRATPSRTAALPLRPATLVVMRRPGAGQSPLLLVGTAPAAMPRPVYLTGTVLDPNGQPCPGVCVFPTTNTHQIAVTNAQGAFQLQVLTHTALSLQAEYVGLGSSRMALADYSGQPVRFVLGR